MSAAAHVAILVALRELAFAALARSHGVSSGRVRRVLERLPVPWCDWSLLVGGEGPITLGIDEHSFRGQDLVISLSYVGASRRSPSSTGARSAGASWTARPTAARQRRAGRRCASPWRPAPTRRSGPWRYGHRNVQVDLRKMLLGFLPV